MAKSKPERRVQVGKKVYDVWPKKVDVTFEELGTYVVIRQTVFETIPRVVCVTDDWEEAKQERDDLSKGREERRHIIKVLKSWSTKEPKKLPSADEAEEENEEGSEEEGEEFEE